MDDKKKQEVKYQPQYFIDDLAALMVSFQEKIRIISEIEFDTKQKALISGLMLNVSTTFLKLNEVLADWGFMPRIEK